MIGVHGRRVGAVMIGGGLLSAVASVVLAVVAVQSDATGYLHGMTPLLVIGALVAVVYTYAGLELRRGARRARGWATALLLLGLIPPFLVPIYFVNIVLLVMLVAAANLTSLQLARALDRGREFAVRTALGAGRGRMTRHLIAESLLLAILGSAAGLVLALAVSASVTGTTDVPRAVADAAARGDVAQVQELLRSGADVNTAQGDGMTALHWAASRGDLRLTEVLIYSGANVGAGTRIGRYLVWYGDGKRDEVPIVYGEDIRDWTFRRDPEPRLGRADVAWMAQHPSVGLLRLFHRVWRNPRPEVKVDSIDLVSDVEVSSPLLVAVTAEP